MGRDVQLNKSLGTMAALEEAAKLFLRERASRIQRRNSARNAVPRDGGDIISQSKQDEVHCMRRREFLHRTAVACTLLPLPACSRRAANKLDRDSDKHITGLLEELKVPGLSIATIKDARVQGAFTFGFKSSESKKPVDSSTLFEVGSMSKPVIAYAVMRLYEKGVLDLDTPLTRYTKRRFVEGDSRLDRITARRVLSHTTGLPNWRSLTAMVIPRWKFLGDTGVVTLGSVANLERSAVSWL